MNGFLLKISLLGITVDGQLETVFRLLLIVMPGMLLPCKALPCKAFPFKTLPFKVPGKPFKAFKPFMVLPIAPLVTRLSAGRIGLLLLRSVCCSPRSPAGDVWPPDSPSASLC